MYTPPPPPPPISTVYGSTEHSRRHIGQAHALCAEVRKKHVPLASPGMDYNLKMVTTYVTRYWNYTIQKFQ